MSNSSPGRLECQSRSAVTIDSRPDNGGSRDLLSLAREYVAAGLSAIPVKADGTKAPALPKWEPYQNRKPTDDELARWFAAGEWGVGIPCGKVSGNLAVLDFETGAAWERWQKNLPADTADFLSDCPIVRAPGGGAHVWVRLPEPVPGAKLARRADKSTLIEVRGAGNYVLAPGCPRACNPKGPPYSFEQRGWLDGPNAPPTPFNVWFEWCDSAANQTEYTPPAPTPEPSRPERGEPTDDDAGTDFSRRGTWEETGLFAAGWKWFRYSGDDSGQVTRPGKDTGCSASLGWSVSQKHGGPMLYVFTSNGHPFDAGRGYDRFGAFARLNHGGDFSAAAKALADRGYGRRSDPGPTPVMNPPTSPDGVGGAAQPATPRKSRWPAPLPVSQLPDRGPVVDWLCTGLLARRHVTMFSALMKAGKTTFMSHLLRALQAGSPFIGRDAARCRTLFVSEESTDIWRGRRDALALDDSLHLLCRPMIAKPSQLEWVDFVHYVGECAAGFDLVIFDTIGAFAPWKNENDAAEVTAALTPLNILTEAGHGVCLFHHHGKSDGGEGRAARGSTALAGAVDILLELRRFKPDDADDRRRVLSGLGRFDEIPTEIVISLAADGTGYTATGDRKAEAAKELRELILDRLPSEPPGVKVDELHESLPEADRPERSAVASALKAGVPRGDWIVEGTGRRGSPQRFRRVIRDSGLAV